MTPTNAQRSAQMRARVLASALDLFGADGYEATSLARIAREAGVSTGAVYHHWASKQDLFAEVVDALHEQLERSSTAGSTPPEQWRATAHAFLACCAQPAFSRVMLTDGPHVLGARWHAIDQARWLAPTMSVLRRAGAAGDPAMLRATATALLGSLTELGRLIADDPAPATLRAAETVVDQLFTSAAPGPRGRA